MSLTEQINFGWVKPVDRSSSIVEQATACVLRENRPISVGDITINSYQGNYQIVAYNHMARSWDVTKSKGEEGLFAAKNKAESLFKGLFK